MKITVFGCGSSYGVPRIGCKCEVCLSDDLRNKRRRSSIMIEKDNVRIIVDVGPEFRSYCLDHKIDDIDAVIITHAHYDHIGGLGDLKPISINRRAIKNDWDFAIHKPEYNIDVYANVDTLRNIEQNHSYVLSHSIGFINTHTIHTPQTINIKGVEVNIFSQVHGSIESLGIQVGNFVYSTDFKELSEEGKTAIMNADVWIAECLRYEPNGSHQSYDEILELVKKLAPKQTFLTHLDHQMDYKTMIESLPKSILPCYDGMTIAV